MQRSYVLRAEIFASHVGTGICVLSGDYQFFVINNVNDVKVKRLQNPFRKLKFILMSETLFICLKFETHFPLPKKKNEHAPHINYLSSLFIINYWLDLHFSFLEGNYL